MDLRLEKEPKNKNNNTIVINAIVINQCQEYNATVALALSGQLKSAHFPY